MSQMDEVKEFYKGKKVLVTGHTGFKGSWLAYWLWTMGADVMGVSREPHTNPNHYDLLKLKDKISCVNSDLRNNHVLMAWKPEIVIHLAANAIIPDSFKDPRETFDNNIMAAVNVLDACYRSDSVKALVMITTDKVYDDKGWIWGYRENDELGGTDPYSASKVAIEYIIESYRTHFFPMIATARAGNVIGGGDWGKGRLIPDVMRAASKGEKVVIHTPLATRPWQHVLEPLYGYLLLGKGLYEGRKECADTFNFGPMGEMTVLEVLKEIREIWEGIEVEIDETETHPAMVNLLKIDSSKAKRVLGWETVLEMENAIQSAAQWYLDFYKEGLITTADHIKFYEDIRRGY
jgi:CDP-glucose 4,6-dehydratase